MSSAVAACSCAAGVSLINTAATTLLVMQKASSESSLHG
jgi:hypothetical protein